VKTLRDWHRHGTATMVTRLAATGAAAGVAAWLVALATYRFLGVARPGVTTFVRAVLEGVVIGGLLGTILGARWSRNGGPGS
jgi:hypothetical protein